MHDLHAAGPVSDIVCPMYASATHRAVVARGRDTRRPLILCEYSHAMGKSDGLADYFAAFERAGLQGGFVWEWCDHGFRRATPTERWFAYGGDFGEDAARRQLLCDGLVSPDRVPHPAGRAGRPGAAGACAPRPDAGASGSRTGVGSRRSTISAPRIGFWRSRPARRPGGARSPGDRATAVADRGPATAGHDRRDGRHHVHLPFPAGHGMGAARLDGRFDSSSST